MAQTLASTTITYHKPGTRPPLYVAGTFSDPPWQPQEMDHTARDDGEYDFRKEIHVEPGSTIQYKFRVGDGEWVLKDDGPTTTDSSGNLNNVLVVESQEEALDGHGRDHENPQDGQESPGADRPLSYAKVAAKQFELPAEEVSTDHSGTGTPIFARVAAEVADSAELLHEEVPEREKPEGNHNRGEEAEERKPDAAEVAPEVPEESKKSERRQSTVVILEPPAGEGRPFQVRPQSEECLDDQDESIADKSPLFAHECAGMHEMDDELTEEEDDTAHTPPPFQVIDPNKVDLNDPTLEHFPSSKDDIMETVQKLQTGLTADHPSFNYKPPSPVFNPSRRGTEDITGDFTPVSPQSASPSSRRASKNASRGSTGSLSAAVSLHSISEDEEAVVDEVTDSPAVVFANPLKPKPQHQDIPTGNEDEGVVMQEGVSPTALKPQRASVVSSEGSRPPSPGTVPEDGRSADPMSAEAELGKDKDRSVQEVKLHPVPHTDDSGPGQVGPDKCGAEANGEDAAVTKSPVSSAGAAATESAGATTMAEGTSGRKTTKDSGESEEAASQRPRRRSYAEVAASKPPQVDASSEDMPNDSKLPGAEHHQESGGGGGKDGPAPNPPPGPRRPSYAEVAGSKPPQYPSTPSSSGKAPETEPAPPTSPTGTDVGTADRDHDEGVSTSKDLQTPVGGDDGSATSDQESAGTPDAGAVGVPIAHPKFGAGWARAMLRLIFIDWVGGALTKVLRLFELNKYFGAERERESERD